MKTRHAIATALFLLVMLASLALGIYHAIGYRDIGVRQAQAGLLQHELRKVDDMADDQDAVEAYEQRFQPLPEIRLRIVQRQWRIAQQLFTYRHRAQTNVELQGETAAYEARLKTILDEMIERCSAALADSATLSPSLSWQFYNAAGSAKVLNAYVMLESDQNTDKVLGVIRDALQDYKSAIDAVDRAGVDPSVGNIPRWNFEMLHGEGNVRQFDVFTTGMENYQALKENLETVIPEIGGYGPGEPVNTIIRK